MFEEYKGSIKKWLFYNPNFKENYPEEDVCWKCDVNYIAILMCYPNSSNKDIVRAEIIYRDGMSFGRDLSLKELKENPFWTEKLDNKNLV